MMAYEDPMIHDTPRKSRSNSFILNYHQSLEEIALSLKCMIPLLFITLIIYKKFIIYNIHCTKRGLAHGDIRSFNTAFNESPYGWLIDFNFGGKEDQETTKYVYGTPMATKVVYISRRISLGEVFFPQIFPYSWGSS
jgi:hypothetical protein